MDTLELRLAAANAAIAAKRRQLRLLKDRAAWDDAVAAKVIAIETEISEAIRDRERLTNPSAPQARRPARLRRHTG